MSMPSLEPTPYMRWWDAMDAAEMRHVRRWLLLEREPRHRFDYAVEMAVGDYDHTVIEDIEARAEKWHEYLGKDDEHA